jgi:colicin import membrane protein
MAPDKMIFDPPSGGAVTAGFGRMLVLSLAAHALVVVLFSGLLVPPVTRDDRPVYYVDLINLPVARPQAGRPDGSKGAATTAQKPAPKKAEPKKTEPARSEPDRTPGKAAAKVQLPPKKTAPVKEQAPKVKAPPEKEAVKEKATVKEKSVSPVKPRSVEKEYQQSVLGAVEALRAKKAAEQAEAARKAKIAALKDKLAAMTGTAASAGTGSGAPLGVADGRGDQAGPSWSLWLQTYLTSNWSLSRYQVKSRDLEAVIHVVYDRDGNLIRKSLSRSSGDPVFDRSVEDAVLKSRTLPKAPGQRMEFDIMFNLKDLLEKK